MRSLPFSTEAFFALFEQYNRAIWPAQPTAYALALAAILMAVRPFPGSSRLIGLLLAAAWLWNGVAYHFLQFAQINFWAPALAALFVAQGLLFAWTGALRGRLAFRLRADLVGLTGLGFVIFAMVLYPLLGWLAGHGWPRAPMFGVAPCPTAIFTWGMLLMTRGRIPLHLLWLPFIWSLIGGTAAFLLAVPEDLALPLTALVAIALLLRRNRRLAAVAR